MTIRAAVDDDVDALLALWAAAGSVATPTDDAGAVRALIAHDPRAMLVLEDDGVVIGSLLAGFDGWRGSFHRLAVHPDHRGRGLGRRLVDHGRALLADRGVKRISVIVDADDAQAMAVWKALGYRHEPNRARYRLDI